VNDGLCRTCQLYSPTTGCVEYGLVGVMPAACPKYVEDYYLTRRMAKVARAADSTLRPEATGNKVKRRKRIAPEMKAKILELSGSGLSYGAIARQLGIGVSSVSWAVMTHRARAEAPEATSRSNMQTLCASCARAKVCFIYRQLQDATSDPLVKVKAVVTECEAHEARGEKAS